MGSIDTLEIDMSPHKPIIAKGNTATSATVDGVRQMLVFPPEGIARRFGLVREHYVLIELANTAVYHFRISCDCAPVPAIVAKVAEIVTSLESFQSEQPEWEASIAWHLNDAKVQFLELNLAAPLDGVWPLRAAALEKSRLGDLGDIPVAEFALRVDSAHAILAATLETSLRLFIGGLKMEILELAKLWGELGWSRYNYFARANTNKIREYRLQSAKVMPALSSLLSRGGTAEANVLAGIVDSGQPLVASIAQVYRIRLVTARHAIGLPAQMAEDCGLSSLMRALDSVPERFPDNLQDWIVFHRLAFDIIPKITGRKPSSKLNGALLAAISGRGWGHADKQLTHLCSQEIDVTQFRYFSTVYHDALASEIIRATGQSSSAADAASASALEATFARVAVPHLLETVRSFPWLARCALRDLSSQDENLKSRQWKSAIDEPMKFGGCVIDAVCSVVQLAALAKELDNCLSDYAVECAEGSVHIFSISTWSGERLGAAGFRFGVNESGDFVDGLFDYRAQENDPLCEQGRVALVAFRNWLRGDGAQNRLADLRRQAFVQKGSMTDLDRQLKSQAHLAALRVLRHKPLRFDRLREKALSFNDTNGVRARV